MIALAILLFTHTYIGWRIAPALPGTAASDAFGAVLVASFLLIASWWTGRRRRAAGPAADRWSNARMLAFGGWALLFVLTVLRDLVLLVALPFDVPQLAAWSAIAVPVLAMLAGVCGWAAARRTARVKEVEVPIAGLHGALHGFTIVQLSDVHVGASVKRPYVQAIVDAVNRLDADAVAITGDLVDGRVADLHADVAPLAGLRSRHGTFFVTGNHEYYSGAHEWTTWLARLGMRVLHNEHVVLAHGEGRLVMAGVTDFGAGHFDPGHRSDPARAMHGAPADADLRVLLAHQPRSAPAAADAGFEVQLSGHTHGGQIWPFHHLVPLQQPFVAGLRRLRQLWVYTSRGTGYWGPPMRIGAPSEITRLRFVAER
jgi:predicted MPP superfamily phosphohydrolase